MPKLEYLGDVYRPGDDTWLLIDLIDAVKPRGELCVDLGAGSGVLGLYTLLNVSCNRVVFIDVSEEAVASIKVNVFLNNVVHRSLVVLSDAISLRNGVADIVLANPPYLPAYSSTIVDIATEGGIEGYETILYFLEYASSVLKPGKELFIVWSSLSKPEVVERYLELHGFRIVDTMHKHFFYETLIASRCVKL
ncbi:MAG: methyltransferase [Desulfurococcaceae archaeon]